MEILLQSSTKSKVEPQRRRSLVFVGNAPLSHDYSDFIDNCDYVIRFNNCKNYGGHSGTKTDLLVVNSTGDPNGRKALRDLLQQRTPAQIAADLPYVTEARHVWFMRPEVQALLNFYRTEFDPDLPRVQEQVKKIEKFGNLAEEMVRRLAIPRGKVRMITESEYRAIWKTLQRYGTTQGISPSTGIVGIHMLMAEPEFAEHEKYLVGFTWEGWDGHPWVLEYFHVRSLIRADKLRMLDEAPFTTRIGTWARMSVARLTSSFR